jgi:hypothetical protein
VISPLPARPIDPLRLAGALGCIAVVTLIGGALGLPTGALEWGVALVATLLFLGAASLASENGLVLLLLSAPFFLVEHPRPFLWIQELLLAATLIRGFLFEPRGESGRRGWGWPAFLFAASALVSLPANLGEVACEYRLATPIEFFRSWTEPGSHFFHLRTLLDVAGWVGVFLLCARRPRDRSYAIRLAEALAASWVGLLLLSGVFYFREPAAGRPFLSFWLGSQTTQGFRGFDSFATNVGYFAEWALLAIPWVMLAALAGSSALTRRLGGTGVALACVALAATFQRGAWGALAVELALAAWLLSRHRPTVEIEPSRRRNRLATPLGAFSMLAAIGAALLLSPIGRIGAEKVVEAFQEGDWIRSHLLRVSARMLAQHPLIGVGTGRFVHFFRSYSEYPFMPFGSWSAHNLYAQLAAEQGLLGIGSFLLLLLLVGRAGLRTLPRLSPADRLPLALPAVALLGLLIDGLFLWVFQIRAVALTFWIGLGLVASLSSTDFAPAVPSRRTRGVLLSLLLLLLGVRAVAGLRRPPEPGYESGLHRFETGAVRWTTGRSVQTLRVEGSILRLRFSNLAISRAGRPQQVSIFVDGEPAGGLLLRDAAWQAVELPVRRQRGATIFLETRVDWTFVPHDLGFGEDRRTLGVETTAPAWR